MILTIQVGCDTHNPTRKISSDFFSAQVAVATGRLSDETAHAFFDDSGSLTLGGRAPTRLRMEKVGLAVAVHLSADVRVFTKKVLKVLVLLGDGALASGDGGHDPTVDGLGLVGVDGDGGGW